MNIVFNALTIIVIAILAFFTWRGWRKGLLRTVLSLCSLILSLLLVWLLYPHVSTILGSFAPLRDGINKQVNEFLTEEIPQWLDETLDTAGIAEQNSLIDLLPLTQELKDKLALNNTTDTYLSLGVESFAQYLSASITTLIIQGISFLLTLLVSVIGLHLLVVFLDLVTKLPGVHGMNQTGGAVAGLVIGYLVVQILFLVITTFSSTGWGRGLMEQINESSILTFLYNSSVTIKILFSQLTEGFQG